MFLSVTQTGCQSPKSPRRRESSKESSRGFCVSLLRNTVFVKVDVLGMHPSPLIVSDSVIYRLFYGCFTLTSVRRDVFANNRLSLPLVSSTSLAHLFIMATSLSFGAVSQIHACLTDPEYGPSLAADKSAFMYTVRDEGLKDLFDYIKHHVRQPTVYICCVVYSIVFSLTSNRSVGRQKTENEQPDFAYSFSFFLLEWSRYLK
jgi:hypothetical protein